MACIYSGMQILSYYAAFSFIYSPWNSSIYKSNLTCMYITHHWNDDLKKMIEQGGTNHKFKYIDGCACKMAQMKIIWPGLFWLDQNCRSSYGKIDFYLE